MRLIRGSGVLLCATLLSANAIAQTTSQIIGEVKGADNGQPLAAAVVVATSPGLQGEQLVVTDDAGKFSFTLLPPGAYTLNVQRDGYKPVEQKGINLPLNRTLRVNLEMMPESIKLEEVVIVSKAPPVIDQGSTTAGIVLNSKMIADLPKARRMEALTEMAPGAQNDLYGVSLGGASSNENLYVIDGQNVGNPAYGLLGTNLSASFMDEMEVKSGGYRAEYGRSSSGIVNMTTKRGGNDLHGSVFASVTPFQSDRIAIGRAGEAINTTTRGVFNTDFGLDVGGPILKDTLWFYGGFAPFLDRTFIDRNVNRLLDEDNNGLADVDPVTGLRKSALVKRTESTGTRNSYSYVGKLTWQANEDNRVELFAYGDPTSTGGGEGEVAFDRRRGAVLSGIFNGERGFREYQGSYGGNDLGANWSSRLLDKKVIVEAAGGWHHEIWLEEPIKDEDNDLATIRNEFNRSLTSFTEGQNDKDILAGCSDAPGSTFIKCPVNRYVVGGIGFPRDHTLDRYSGDLKLSYFLEAAGAHVFKGGLGYELNSYTNRKFYTGGRFMRERIIGGARVYDDFRRYGYEDPKGSGKAHYYDQDVQEGGKRGLSATTETSSLAFFAQDTWNVLDLFTLDGGVRWEIQKMTDDGHGPTGEVQTPLNLSDNIAPRLGLIYDFTRTGKGKVYGYFGRFYEMIPLDMADRAFASEPQVFTRYDPNNCTDPNDPRTCAMIPNAFGPGQNHLFVGAEPSPVLSDIRGQYNDQYLAGIEYEVLPNMALKLEYTNNSLGRVIEDMSVDDGNHYFIGNPGEGQGLKATKADGTVVEFPKPNRTYQALTLSVNKVFAGGWQAMASYTFSRLRGNYPGLFKPDTGQLDPNILSDFDLPDLLANRDGPLGGDVPHQFKLDGSYAFPVSVDFGLVAGLSLRGASGAPINTLGAHESYGSGEAYVLPRGTAACRVIDNVEDCSDRTPAVYRADVRLKAVYRFAGQYTMEASWDVLNVFNFQETTGVDDNYTYDSVYPIVGGTPDQLKYLKTTHGDPVVVNKNYGNTTSRQTPLTMRFAAKVTF